MKPIQVTVLFSTLLILIHLAQCLWLGKEPQLLSAGTFVFGTWAVVSCSTLLWKLRSWKSTRAIKLSEGEMVVLLFGSIALVWMAVGSIAGAFL